MLPAGADDSFHRCVFEQPVGREEADTDLPRTLKWNRARAARTKEWFSLLCLSEVHVISFFRNQPDTGIAYARPENFFRRYYRECTSRLACHRVVCNC